MTRDDIERVQVSFEAAKPHADILIENFYATLFALSLIHISEPTRPY